MNAIQGPSAQETTGEYDRVHSDTTNNACIGKIHCGLCHLPMGRTDLDETIPGTKLRGHVMGGNWKGIFH
mgnify:CR=1 FL=1